MDKTWVWLPRNSREYEQGAVDFVNASARNLGNPPNMICPCVDCRNVSHQPVATVLDHLVIRGMDQKYKRNSCWSIHGDKMNERDEVPSSSFEAYELLRTVFSDADNGKSLNDNGDQHEDVESQEDSVFKKKLKDAETPLYTNCLNYTKVSAIMGL